MASFVSRSSLGYEPTRRQKRSFANSYNKQLRQSAKQAAKWPFEILKNTTPSLTLQPNPMHKTKIEYRGIDKCPRWLGVWCLLLIAPPALL